MANCTGQTELFAPVGRRRVEVNFEAAILST
jgi:hypothetical protein